MSNYEYEVQKLIEKGLLSKEATWIACCDTMSTFAMLFGAIGGAIAGASVKHHILAVDSESIKLFDVNKKSGEYIGSMLVINKNDIIKLNVSGSVLKVKSNRGSISVMLPKKLMKYDQKQKVIDIVSLIRKEYKS